MVAKQNLQLTVEHLKCVSCDLQGAMTADDLRRDTFLH